MMLKLKADRICEEYMTFEISISSLIKQLERQLKERVKIAEQIIKKHKKGGLC